MKTATKARSDEATKGVTRHGSCLSLRRSVAPSLRRSAFTLTEILIVIGIIVLLIALAVPAFSLITGGKSIEGATNQLSAALGRARAEAIGLQKPTGILFFIEPRSGRVHIAIVTQADSQQAVPNPSITIPGDMIWLDLANDSDFIPLPIGVSAQTISDSTFTGPNRNSDGYLGFNIRGTSPGGGSNDVSTAATPVPGARFGGVILFDGSGRLISSSYGFKCVNSANLQSRIGGLLKPSAGLADMIPGPPPTATVSIRSQFGLVMFERDPFTTQGATEEDSKIATNPPYGGLGGPADEFDEEKWLDENSTPILINRYTGTLVKGE